MNMSKKEYDQYVRSMSPRSPMGKNLFNAFWVGGLICTVGQFFLNGFQAWDWTRTMPAAPYVL